MFSNNSVSISLPAHLNSPRTKFKVKFNSQIKNQQINFDETKKKEFFFDNTLKIKQNGIQKANNLKSPQKGLLRFKPNIQHQRQNKTCKPQPLIHITYKSPQKPNPLVQQPPIPQSQKPFNRIITPPSLINHDKLKKFQDNPEGFFVDLDDGLDKAFKKSMESLIRTAKIIPVKDFSITDSTDLLDGFVHQQ